MDNEYIKAIGIVLSFAVLTVLGFSIFNRCNIDKENKQDIIQIVDTTYNKIVLDSIQINIKQRDSVITKIKYRMQYEVKKADTISNDSAVKLFKQLCTD